MLTGTVALGPIASLSANAGQTGSGRYLLTGLTEHVGASGQACLQLTLEDATGRVTGFVWPEARATVVCPAPPAPVTLCASVQSYADHPQLKIQSLIATTVGEIPSAVAMLPRQRCPEAALPALTRLGELERSLPAPLDGFLREVLLDPQVTLPILTCRASVAHHHAFQGGLLVHSAEMLDLARDLAQRTAPEDPWAPHLAQLAYLLHDLGKLRSVGSVRRPQFALVVRHEQLTIELLAPHLRWLELRNRELATALRYVFGYLATPAKARTPPNYFIAELVETMDQWSAAGCNHRDLERLLYGHARPAPRHVVRAPIAKRPATSVRHG